MITTHGAALGDAFTVITDDMERGKVFPKHLARPCGGNRA